MLLLVWFKNTDWNCGLIWILGAYFNQHFDLVCFNQINFGSWQIFGMFGSSWIFNFHAQNATTMKITLVVFKDLKLKLMLMHNFLNLVFIKFQELWITLRFYKRTRTSIHVLQLIKSSNTSYKFLLNTNVFYTLWISSCQCLHERVLDFVFEHSIPPSCPSLFFRARSGAHVHETIRKQLANKRAAIITHGSLTYFQVIIRIFSRNQVARSFDHNRGLITNHRP